MIRGLIKACSRVKQKKAVDWRESILPLHRESVEQIRVSIHETYRAFVTPIPAPSDPAESKTPAGVLILDDSGLIIEDSCTIESQSSEIEIAVLHQKVASEGDGEGEPALCLEQEPEVLSTPDFKEPAKSEPAPQNIELVKQIKFLKQKCNDYLWKRITPAKLGKMYERYTGFILETEGYEVEYHGIKKKLNDGGVDLIAKKKGVVFLIQCKYWAEQKGKMQGENAIHQFHGKAEVFSLKYDKKKIFHVKKIFISHSHFTSEARRAAEIHNINLRTVEMPKDRKYAFAKCFRRHGKWHFCLPFQTGYDKVKTEKYLTIEEAASLNYELLS